MSQPTPSHRYISGRGNSTSRTYNAARYRATTRRLEGSASHAVRPRPARSIQLIPQGIQNIPPPAEVTKTFNEQGFQSPPKPIVSDAANRPLIQDAFPPAKLEKLAKKKPKKSQVLNRQVVEKPFNPPEQELLSDVSSVEKTKRLPLVRLKTVLTSVAVLLLVAGSGSFAAFAINGYYDKKDIVSSEEVLSGSVDRVSSIQTQQQENVDETPVSADDIKNHSAPDRHPNRVSIGSVDIEARVSAAGVNRYQQLILPDNIYDVNWYEGSRLPGQSGTVLLSGYVSGPTERGSFYYLRALRHGDIISIETGDGTKYDYEIKHRELKPYDQLDLFDLLVPYEAGGNWLHVVAVDDRYNVMTEGFQDRLIIYAEQK